MIKILIKYKTMIGIKKELITNVDKVFLSIFGSDEEYALKVLSKYFKDLKQIKLESVERM